MGMFDRKQTEKLQGFNWAEPSTGYSRAGGKPFIICHLKSGQMVFNSAWCEKFEINKDINIAFNLEGFDTAFILNPKEKGIPFFKIKRYEEAKVMSFGNKKLLTDLIKQYEIEGNYKKFMLKPFYFGIWNGMEIYKMVPYKDSETKFYDGRTIENQGKDDPHPYPKMAQ